MFTMDKIRDGSTYLSQHLSANDYYAEGEKVTGCWVGSGAALLGLEGEVRPREFELLRTNCHPITGNGLTPHTREERVAFYDFQCAPQKSVSIMAVVGDDERLRAAHEAAAKVALAELEQFATRQKNTLLKRNTEVTANVCTAAFTHDASRALDPQLHTHFVIANATRAENGKWYALNEYHMVKAARYAGKVYQNELAHAVKALGYQIRETRGDDGEITGFELEGVSHELCKRYAKRREEIERGIKAFEKKYGREPSRAEISQITRDTRGAKMAEISTLEVRVKQIGELTEDEHRQLFAVKQEAIWNTGRVHYTSGYEAQAVEASVAHLFERQSVVKEHAVLAEALNQDLGGLNLTTLKEAFAKNPKLIRLTDEPGLQSECATAEGLAEERWAVEFVNTTKERFAPLNPDFVPDGGLSEEQQAAVHAILNTKDQVFAFRGVAGSGKTTTLQEVNRELAKYFVYYIAPTTAAVKVLKEEGFRHATTVEDFLQNVSRRAWLRDAVVICDEAGLQSNRQGAALLHLAEQLQMRVLLVGDARQHVNPEAGDFLRVLETHSDLGRCEVLEIRRQQPPEYKEAIIHMAHGDARGGLQKLDGLGWLHEGKADYLNAAANDYLKLLFSGQNDVLVVAPTWKEYDVITDIIREKLKLTGYLDRAETKMKVFNPTRWTAQQRGNCKNYLPGQVIVFNARVHGWKTGEYFTVLGTEGKSVMVRDDSGVERKLPLKAARSFEVGSFREIDVVPKDKILIRANQKKIGLVNGQVLTVQSVQPDGAIETNEGITIAATFKEWCHGYVVTSHKSQGRTCEHVIVAAEGLDAKAAYVACSRGRQTCSIHTPDKARLLERLPEGNRQAALDVIANKATQSIPSSVQNRTGIWMRLVDVKNAIFDLLQVSSKHSSIKAIRNRL